MSDEQAAQILTVGQAVDFVLAHQTGRADARAMMLLAELLEELPEESRAPGLHPRLLERAAQRLLRAPGVPRRQRAGARRDRAPVPAPGGRALRRGPADEDPRAGCLGRLLPGGGRAPGAAERLRAAAPEGGRESAAALRGDRARARLGDRGGDRRLLPARRLRAHRARRSWRPSRRRSRRRSSTRWTSSRRCRSCSPGAARRSATRSPARRARRTSAPSRWRRASTGASSAAGAGAARSTPSRRRRARPSSALATTRVSAQMSPCA